MATIIKYVHVGAGTAADDDDTAAAAAAAAVVASTAMHYNSTKAPYGC